MMNGGQGKQSFYLLATGTAKSRGKRESGCWNVNVNVNAGSGWRIYPRASPSRWIPGGGEASGEWRLAVTDIRVGDAPDEAGCCC